MFSYNYEELPQGLSNSSISRNLNYAFLFDLISEKSPAKRPLKVLEIGAGGGRNLKVLHDKFDYNLELYGTDISKISISYAKSLKIGNFYVSSSEIIPIRQKFDLILMIDILEHLESKKHIVKTINAATSHLNDSGLIYISIPTELNRFCLTWIFSKFPYFKYLTREFFGHTVHFSKNTFIALIEDTGLHMKEVFYSTHIATQIQMLFFFYVPKILIRSFFGKETSVRLRDSNELLENKSNMLSHLKKALIATSRPLSYLGHLESVLRRTSSIASGNIHLLLSADKDV